MSQKTTELNPPEKSIHRDRTAQIHHWTMRILHGTLMLSFIEAWIARFIDGNPSMFGRGRE